MQRIPRSLRSRIVRTAVLAGMSGLTILGFAGRASAVSSGGYQGSQQGCQPGDDDYATPVGVTYPGCHSIALNVESGGTSQGDAQDSNVKYLQVGDDQSPNDPNSQGTPTEYSLAYPGQSGSPHAGCVALNTDGTGGSAAPAGTSPVPAGQAADSSYGCGDNPDGTGLATNFDYYQYYCPLAETLGFGCEATSAEGPPGTTSVTPDTGGQTNLTPLVENGILLYYGMDDNTDNTEHDGLGPYSSQAGQSNAGATNGASDGGAITFLLSPLSASQAPTLTHPEGAANVSGGSCADGICEELTTQQQTVYHGCGAAVAAGQAPCDAGTPSNANVYDYAPGGSTANDPSVSSESANCSSGDAQSSSVGACGSGGMDAIRSAIPSNENTEPGIQIYSDPDPQRSPVLPSPLWPTPAVYAGTCGVYIGSPSITGSLLGALPTSVAGIQVTNSAGQIAIDPNPGTC